MFSSVPDEFPILFQLMEILAIAAVVQKFLHGFVLRSSPWEQPNKICCYHSTSEDFAQILSLQCSVCECTFRNCLGLM